MIGVQGLIFSMELPNSIGVGANLVFGRPWLAWIFFYE